MSVQDPMKALDKVTEPDARHIGALGGLAGRHARLDAIRLHDGVPEHVQQLFETAKNLSLYSWFVYRFHPVAKLLGYAVLERALRERLAIETKVDPDSVTKTLAPLMEIASDEKWIRSEGFEAVRRVARVRLEDKQIMQWITDGKIGKEPVELPAIPEDEVLAHAAKMDYVERIAATIPFIRNHLAHGGRVLDPGSAATLLVIAEAVNQLFRDPTTG